MNIQRIVTGAALVVALLAQSASVGGRVSLATLPERERVEIQLDNLQATLVEEERVVTLLRGANEVDFAWSSAQIDKETILFRVTNMPVRKRQADDADTAVRPDGKVEQIRVLSVSYPPNENALVWQVYAEEPFAARVRISYLVKNLNPTFFYRAVAEHDESTLALRTYLQLENLSGEEFGASGIWAGFGAYFHREIGLNEAKQMLLWKFDRVTITKTYTFDWWHGRAVPDEPDQRYVEMRYVLPNDEAHGLGRFPLQRGKVRIFIKDGRDGEAFLGEDWGQFTPRDDRLSLYLGLARDVVVNRTVTRNLRQPESGVPYDQELIVTYRIENFKNTPVQLDILEDMNQLRNAFCADRGDFDAEWEILADGTSLKPGQIERQDVRHVQYHVPLPAAPKGEAKVEAVTVTVHVFLRNVW